MGSLRNLGTNKQELKDSMGITNMSPKMIQMTEEVLENISNLINDIIAAARTKGTLSEGVTLRVKDLSESYATIVSSFNRDDRTLLKELLKELQEEKEDGKP